ncbi:MAG: hypothetical protein HYS09_03185 [Chloroflexi bacterium]|nr:hypothetical protein [Chloroflexota bacterium]
MPIYEYRCPQGHQYERSEGFDAPTEHACPSCGGTSRRLLSLPAVLFKGPGFYSTDNRSDGHRREEGGDSGSSPSAAGDESKSESSV